MTDKLEPTASIVSWTPKKTTFYQPELDSLRFVAFMGVFIFHSIPRDPEFYTSQGVPASLAAIFSGALASGACGVDLFFALSAYLITTLLLREVETTGKLDVRSFYARRILRIWPLYFTFILIAYGVGLTLQSHHRLGTEYVIGFALMAGNWIYVLHGIPLGSIAVPLWSVSIEEQFYLLWPLVVRKSSREMIAKLAWGLLGLSSATRFALIVMGTSQRNLEFSTLMRLDPIALGILLALMADRLPQVGTAVRTLLILSSVTGMVLVGMYCGMYPLNNETVNGLGTLVGRPLVAIFSIFLLVGFIGIRSYYLCNSAVLFLGKISYGLYVVHSLGLKLASKMLPATLGDGIVRYVLHACIGLVVTFVIAFLSYRYLESPFLRMKARFAHVGSRPI